jgi:hypothetical protein
LTSFKINQLLVWKSLSNHLRRWKKYKSCRKFRKQRMLKLSILICQITALIFKASRSLRRLLLFARLGVDLQTTILGHNLLGINRWCKCLVLSGKLYQNHKINDIDEETWQYWGHLTTLHHNPIIKLTMITPSSVKIFKRNNCLITRIMTAWIPRMTLFKWHQMSNSTS